VLERRTAEFENPELRATPLPKRAQSLTGVSDPIPQQIPWALNRGNRSGRLLFGTKRAEPLEN